MTYDRRYCWKNNPVRQRLYGRLCRVLVRMRMNTLLIEMEDGEQVITSRHAVRRVNE